MADDRPPPAGRAPVPLQDPTRDHEELGEAIDAAVERVIASGSFVLGPAVASFEEAFARRVGVDHAVAVNSGTDALVLALDALGMGPGDEVVTSPFSFFATAEAILRVGATPVFADVRPDTLNLDPEATAAAITDRTAAVMPVHLYGQMADMTAFRTLAERHGLALVEDAAQAHGAAQAVAGPEVVLGDAPGAGPESDEVAGAGTGPDALLEAGTAGDVACFSFYPTKNLGGWGDGGMLTTDDDGIAARLRGLRDHGRTSAGGYGHREIGYNSRLDALQAAVLEVKLGALDRWNARRREHAAAYDEALRGTDGLEAPTRRPGNRHVYHQYTLRARDRPALAARLEEAGVGHGVYYPVPLHLQEALEDLGHTSGDFPVAERAAGEVVSLPVFPGLTEAERGRVAEVLAGAAG